MYGICVFGNWSKVGYMNPLKPKVDAWKQLQAEMKRIQAQIDPLKAELEQAVLDAGGSLDVEGDTLKLIEAMRESIAVKEARAKFGDAAEALIKKSFYTMFKVN
jgi:hypothetical protein